MLGTSRMWMCEREDGNRWFSGHPPSNGKTRTPWAPVYQSLFATHAEPLTKCLYFPFLNPRDFGWHMSTHEAILSVKEDSRTRVFLLTLSWSSFQCVIWPLSVRRTHEKHINWTSVLTVQVSKSICHDEKYIFVFPSVLRRVGPGCSLTSQTPWTRLFQSWRRGPNWKTKKERNSYQ